jgi:hypothetical protein
MPDKQHDDRHGQSDEHIHLASGHLTALGQGRNCRRRVTLDDGMG